MEIQSLAIISIDKENSTCLCSDNNEYPLIDGMESLAIEELQNQLNNAKEIVQIILNKIMEENG